MLPSRTVRSLIGISTTCFLNASLQRAERMGRMSEQDPILKRLEEIDAEMRELIGEIEFEPLADFFNQTLFPDNQPPASGGKDGGE